MVDRYIDADVDALVATYFKEYDHDASLEDKSTEAYQKVWNAEIGRAHV